MEICYQKNKMVIYAEGCPEVKLRALAADKETKLLTDCCRLALKYAKEEVPDQSPQWFNERFMAFCKEMTKPKNMGQKFLDKTVKQKLLLFSDYEKGEHPFINFCARGYDETEITDKKGNKKVGPWRKQKAVHLSGLVGIDIDHVEDAKAIFERWQKEVDFKALKIYFIYITPRGGLRVIFRCEVSRGNLIDNQLWMCEKLGVDPDESCKDASRGYFLTSQENFLYDDLKTMYEDEPDEEFISKYEPEYRAGHSSATKTGTQTTQTAGQGSENVRTVDAQGMEGVANVQCSMFNVQCIKWRGYDVQKIIDARYADKLPCEADSNRHTESLKLATDLLIMLDGDKQRVQAIVERQPWVQEIIDARNENVAQTVESASKQLQKKEEHTSKPYPSKAMQAAIEKVAGMPFREVVAEDGSEKATKSSTQIEKLLQEWGEEIEALFDDFPMLRDVCAGLKKSQYPAALFVAGGTLMTDMTRTWYRFYHRPQQERRLNACLFIIGHPASNKSMADDIYDILSEPIASADKAGKAALNRYKQDQKKKAANKEGKDKPQGIIRIHPARTSNGQLIQDMLNAKETIDGKEIQLHMLTFDTELDNATTLQSGGSWINKMSMELKSFHNEKDGQMYQNSDSPVDEFHVTWNFIYTGTPIALKKKVNERNFGSGLSTRLAVIPVPKTNCEMIAFEEESEIDWDRIVRMKAWAYKLDRRFGELPLWGLVRKIYDWTKNRMEDCKDDDSEANELMLKRVPYHALNYAAPFIDMRHWESLHQEEGFWVGDYETDETDWKLCELIARIQYATQQHFFGVMAEKYFDDMNNDVQITGKRHHQKSVDGYNRLPEVFTTEDVQKCFGYDNENTIKSKIRRMLQDGVIEKLSDSKGNGSYRKLNRMIV